MYCKNCGNRCNETDTNCSNCGHQLDLFINNNVVNTQNNNEVYSKEDKDKANLLCAISLICFFSPILFGGINNILNNYAITKILSNVSGVLELASLSLMIYVRIKYPKNIFAKVLMWTYIILIALFMVFIFMVLVSCAIAISQCS